MIVLSPNCKNVGHTQADLHILNFKIACVYKYDSFTNPVVLVATFHGLSTCIPLLLHLMSSVQYINLDFCYLLIYHIAGYF